ncbi:MAG TPA: TRAP transporter small permease [Beijerinckiaceae bacterium]|nr:TRAP transporter small permease [Beijerinckiaceae bacterium]
MADQEPPASGRDKRLERITGWLATFGGLLALAVAMLVAVSVLGRWLFSAPIDGDFEFVKMATAVAVFSYLPYTQARCGNIMVDTFTTSLSPRINRRLDAFWDFVYALFVGGMAVALAMGTLDALRSGETTMQRQILLWPSIGATAVLCLVLAMTALTTGMALLKDRQDRG